MKQRVAPTVGWLSVLVLACTVGAARAQPETDSVMTEMGAETYLKSCASCHGRDGKGRGPAAGAMTTPPTDLTRISARRDGVFPEGEMARVIDGRFEIAAHGSREMPVWGERFGERIPEAGVSEEVVRGRIFVLVEYLKSIQAPD
jgi:mono/diheme cytochrome c family protein